MGSQILATKSAHVSCSALHTSIDVHSHTMSITHSQVLYHSSCCKGPQQGKHPPGVPGRQLAAR